MNIRNIFKQLITEIRCKHNYKMIEGTCHMVNMGSSKGATFKCSKCGKTIWSDIFKKRVNR